MHLTPFYPCWSLLVPCTSFWYHCYEMVLLYLFYCFHFIDYSMLSSYIIVFFPSYLLSYWILSYLEALSYSWWTSFIWSLFGLVNIIIRFKDGHIVNACQTHICHILLLCITVQCYVHSLLYCITHSFLFHLLSLSFNLHSFFILLTNHTFHLLIFVISAYFLLSSLWLIVYMYLGVSSI